MSMYKCIPAVKKKCGIDCEGTYNGTDCECAKINMAYLPPTARGELTAYRAIGFTPEEIADIVALFNELADGLSTENGRSIINEWKYLKRSAINMPNCTICKKPVASGYVIDGECLKKLQSPQAENERLRAERDAAIKDIEQIQLNHLRGIIKYTKQYNALHPSQFDSITQFLLERDALKDEIVSACTYLVFDVLKEE